MYDTVASDVYTKSDAQKYENKIDNDMKKVSSSFDILLKKTKKQLKDHRHRVNVEFKEVKADMSHLDSNLKLLEKEVKRLKRNLIINSSCLIAVLIAILIKIIA